MEQTRDELHLDELRGDCRTGERLDALDLQSLVELDIHGLGSLGDLQVPHTTSEGGAGGQGSLTNSNRISSDVDGVVGVAGVGAGVWTLCLALTPVD